jgi:hypothetical protein
MIHLLIKLVYYLNFIIMLFHIIMLVPLVLTLKLDLLMLIKNQLSFKFDISFFIFNLSLVQERLHTIIFTYYHKWNTIHLVNDIAKRDTFQNLRNCFSKIEKLAIIYTFSVMKKNNHFRIAYMIYLLKFQLNCL